MRTARIYTRLSALPAEGTWVDETEEPTEADMTSNDELFFPGR